MLKPTTEQLALLNGWERFSYRVAHIANHRFKWLLKWWNFFFHRVCSCFNESSHSSTWSRKPTNLDPKSSVLRLITVHFSIFMSSVGSLTGNKTKHSDVLPGPLNFLRGTPGNLVNLVVGGLAMFPVMRSKDKKDQPFLIGSDGRDSVSTKTILGMHPEGTRSKDADAYTFPSVRPGCNWPSAARCQGHSHLHPRTFEQDSDRNEAKLLRSGGERNRCGDRSTGRP